MIIRASLNMTDTCADLASVTRFVMVGTIHGADIGAM
jgi:hypothetical protein